MTTQPPLEPILEPLPRRHRVLLPPDPTEEELARNWTLSQSDRIEVFRCRGDGNRLRFALQLCMLRQYGRFLVEYETVPVRIANHLGRQLDLPPILFVEPPQREATDIEQEGRIRRYLGFVPFSSEMRARLEEWIYTQVIERGPSTFELLIATEDLLLSWKVVLPARSTVERIIASVSSRAQEQMFHRIAEGLPLTIRSTIDELLEVPKEDRRSKLFELKAYPPEPTPAAILTHIERYHLLDSFNLTEVDFAGLNSHLIQFLAQIGRHYDVSELKRFASAKRYAIVTCFLWEAQKTVLDHIVAMNDQFLTGMSRRARNAFERRQQEARRQAKKSLDVVLRAVEILLDPDRRPETVVLELFLELNQVHLRQALSSCRMFQQMEEQGYLNELQTRHSHLKRYLPAFLDLPFRAESGMGALLEALDLARKLKTGQIKELPPHTPTQFISTTWRVALVQNNGQINPSVWEIGLAFALRDALRSGDLYLPASRHHVSFWNLVYDQARWSREREQAYRELHLPIQADHALERLQKEFGQVAESVDRGLPDNPFATIRDGKLKLSRRDALEIPDRVRQLRRTIETHLPRVRIEDLLLEVDSWCHFTREFRPLGGYTSRSENLYATLLAALVAHGTNLGIATMGQSAEGITVDMLQHVSRWFLRTETLKAANKVLVNYHASLELSSVWGDGTASSSDGQRFGIQASSLLASFYPRYFGYYDRAVTVYTHTSDQYSVFASRVISCLLREAIYVLDGLLKNDTILNPREHYTDTHGYTEHLFGLCYLLGYSFMPRLKDLPDQQLYTIGRTSYRRLDPLFHGNIDTALIQQQWDQLVRVAASLKNQTAPAHVVLQRLSRNAPSDRLARALTALGRVVKTIYILRYIHDPAIRQRVQLQLNRGELRHDLAKRLFFANQGIFRTGDYEEIMNKVSALSLLSNAVLVWNTVKIAEIVKTLQASGSSVLPEDLGRISPLVPGHVIPNGTYHFDRSGKLIQGGNIA